MLKRAFLLSVLCAACASSHPVAKTPSTDLPSPEARLVVANTVARVAAMCRNVKGDAESLQLFEKACRGGDKNGCMRAAGQLECGVGTKADWKRASDLSDIACHAGDIEGCAAAGAFAIVRPDAGPADYARAAEVYDRACKINAAACDNIGLFYGVGLGVPKDFERAKALLVKACDQHNAN